MFSVLIRAGSKVSQVDWRAVYPAMNSEWIDYPAEIEQGLRTSMAQMSLTYTAVDFAVTNCGEWIMFECNPFGQYRWLEDALDLPITSALADLLESGARV